MGNENEDGKKCQRMTSVNLHCKCQLSNGDRIFDGGRQVVQTTKVLQLMSVHLFSTVSVLTICRIDTSTHGK